jgi:hypothetical protein
MQNNVGIYASQISGKLWAPAGAYDALATVTLSANAASVTFSGIPSGYKHLQIRGICRDTRSDVSNSNAVRFNGDSAGNYSAHLLYGDGISAYSAGLPNESQADLFTSASASSASNIFGVFVMDILDYANVNKYTTTRTLSGFDRNGGGQVNISSGNWRNTAAVTSIDIRPLYGSPQYVQYSQFALYGVK